LSVKDDRLRVAGVTPHHRCQG